MNDISSTEQKGTNMHDHRHPLTRASDAPVLAVALAITAILTSPAVSAGAGRGTDQKIVFRSVRAQTEQFIDYFGSIRLTAAQERVKAEALDSIPAPCCKDYSMKTCCCPCNLAKSVWGLSHYLIVKQGYNAPQVKRAVLDWLAFVNPKGFTGNACFAGGCKRPFAQNGCAGMESTQVILGDDVR